MAKDMTDKVWWHSDVNWRQEVVHKHTYIIYLPTPAKTTSNQLRWGK